MNATKKGRAKARTTGASPATSVRECCTEGGNDTNVLQKLIYKLALYFFKYAK